MSKRTAQNPDGFDVPERILNMLKGWVSKVKEREHLGHLSGEFCDFRIDAVDYEDYRGPVDVVYATITFGRNEYHRGWSHWEEVMVERGPKGWELTPL